jgi:hypothetical protein
MGSTPPLRASPPRMHPEVFLVGPGAAPRQKLDPPLLTFRPTRTSDPASAVPFAKGAMPREKRSLGKTRLTLLRLMVPSALWSGESTFQPISIGLSPSGDGLDNGLASPVFAALAGFFNLSVLSSSPDLPGLVSCRSHSWDSPFRAFPSRESGAPRRRPLPSCRYPRASSRVTTVARSSRYLAPRPPSGVFPSRESVHMGSRR